MSDARLRELARAVAADPTDDRARQAFDVERVRLDPMPLVSWERIEVLTFHISPGDTVDVGLLPPVTPFTTLVARHCHTHVLVTALRRDFPPGGGPPDFHWFSATATVPLRGFASLGPTVVVEHDPSIHALRFWNYDPLGFLRVLGGRVRARKYEEIQRRNRELLRMGELPVRNGRDVTIYGTPQAISGLEEFSVEVGFPGTASADAQDEPDVQDEETTD